MNLNMILYDPIDDWDESNLESSEKIYGSKESKEIDSFDTDEDPWV